MERENMKTKVIEFLGMPRSGKTTQINLLHSALEKKGFTVALISDRERLGSVHVPISQTMAFQCVFYGKVADEYFKHKGKVDYILIDRGFNDVAVWSDVLYNLNKINLTERKSLVTCWEKLKQVDRLFYFSVSLKVMFQRQKEIKNE